MMRLVIGPVFSIVEDPSQELRKTIRRQLTFSHRSIRPVWSKGQRRRTLKSVSMSETMAHDGTNSIWFLTGFLFDHLKDVLRDALGAWIYPRSGSRQVAMTGWTMTPRDYQSQIASGLIVKARGIASVGTGGGKTEIGLMAIAAIPGWKVWLVNRQELVKQTVKRAESFGFPWPVIGIFDGDTFPLDAPSEQLVVATVQTAYEQIEASTFLSRSNVVLADEIQFLPAKQFVGCFEAAKAAWFRWGLSATPFGDDAIRNARIIGATGPPIDPVIDDAFLSKRGYKATARALLINYGAEFSRELTSRNYEKALSRSKKRNEAIIRATQIAIMSGKRPIVFCRLVNHATQLQESLGDHAGLILGKTPNKERDRIFSRFSSGDLEALVVSRVVDEGVDFPKEVDCAIFAAGGSSSTTAHQRIGRVTRGGSSKEAIIIDFIDASERPKERGQRISIVERQYKQRRKAIAEKVTAMDAVYCNDESILKAMSSAEETMWET